MIKQWTSHQEYRVFISNGIENFISTQTERINNRILNDHYLHSSKIRSKKHFSFFVMIIGINIHLDVRGKVFTSNYTSTA